MLRGQKRTSTPTSPVTLTLQLAVPQNPLAGSVRRGEKAKSRQHRQTVTMRLLCTERPASPSVNHGHATPLQSTPLLAFNLDETHKHMRLTSFGVNLMWRRWSRRHPQQPAKAKANAGAKASDPRLQIQTDG